MTSEAMLPSGLRRVGVQVRRSGPTPLIWTLRLEISMNVAQFLLENSVAPERPALIGPDGAHSFADLDNAAECLSQWLLRSGVQKGDRALLSSENSFFWVACYIGCLRAGCVAVPVATSSTAAEFAYIRDSTSPAVVLLGSRQANHAVPFGGPCVVDGPLPNERGLSPRTSVFGNLLRGGYLSRLPAVTVDDQRELAAIMFTSGSTGTPRGVMVTHRNIISNTESIVEYMRLSRSERVMAVLPFHYCFGTSLLHSHLRAGGSLVIGERFVYLDKMIQRMADTQCTGFAGVPSHLQLLLRISGLNEARLPQLRWIQQAGGKLAVPFIAQLRAALPSVKLFVMYGQTEATARLSYLPPELLDRKMGSVGKGIPGVSLEVVREDGTSAAPGETGQIVASGENITLGYWRNAEDTARHFRDGKLHTGDLATVDNEGFIYIVDRGSDLLKCGGYRVSARQVEDTLLQFEELVEAAVVGMPDDILGEAVRAFVVPRESQPSEERSKSELEARLIHFCKQHLPAYVVPKQIVVVNSLPKNDAGKVLKKELRGWYGHPETPRIAEA